MRTRFGPVPPGNLALNKPATADSSCGASEGPEKAVNGSVSGGVSDKWCSLGADQYLQVDLGASQHLGSLTVRHAGAGGASTGWNTRDFDPQLSADGSTWTTVAAPPGNIADVSTHPVDVTARYIRINVITPTSTGDPAARIYELEAYS